MKNCAVAYLSAAVVALSAGTASAESHRRANGLNEIEHIIVLYLENRSFDNMFALFPGAAGLGNSWRAPPQIDPQTGQPFATLPRVRNSHATPPGDDLRFPAGLPNKPWRIDDYITHHERMPDLVHEFYTHQRQINGGRNDLFAGLSDAAGLTMGYHDTGSTHLWRLAKEYTLADNFFQAAFGGSFLNHIWLACACTPEFRDAPASTRVTLDANGHLVKKGRVTPDGYAVNTIQPRLGPNKPGSDPATLLPPQTLPTIGERLSEKGVSWAWYSGGWDDAEAGKAGKDFQYHHQPYAFFARYNPGTRERAEHIRDDSRFAKDIDGGTLPQVVFIKPYGLENQHPGYANLADADRYAAEVVAKIQASPYWPKTAIIITYDEFGGLYDHVTPPKGDRWGPGTRIPAIVVSPFAKKGYVDHTQYDTVSVLKTIEARFGLKPLTDRDRKVEPMLNAFEFGKAK